MKPYKYLLSSLLILPLVTSCAKEENLDTPVSLNPNIAGVSLTRAATNSSDLSAIGLYAVNHDKTQHTYGTWPAGTYGKYTRNVADNKFVPSTEQQTIWLGLEKAVIYSCHPAPENGSSVTDGNPSTPTNPIPCIPVPQGTIDLSPTVSGSGPAFDFAPAEKDYMYGVKYDASQTPDDKKFTTEQPVADNGRATGSLGSTVSIGLKHAFSQIKVVVKKGDYPVDPVISQVTYTRSMKTLAAPANTTYDVKMQLTDGTLTGLADAADATYTYNLSSLSDGGCRIITDNDLIITNYALPNEASASTITVTADGKEMSINYAGDPAWEAGKIYTYTVSINGTGLKFSGVSIVDWNSPSDNNTSGTI